jgi:hypothetical protein
MPNVREGHVDWHEWSFDWAVSDRVANEHTNNEYGGLIEFSQDNVSWLKINVYARIGAYHILQEWYLSRDGSVMARVGSKGVAINMNHTHHPYWRLDFDIDRPEKHAFTSRNSDSTTTRTSAMLMSSSGMWTTCSTTSVTTILLSFCRSKDPN